MKKTDEPFDTNLKILLPGLRQLCRLFWGPDNAQCREMVAGHFFQPLMHLKGLTYFNIENERKDIQAYLTNRSDPEALFHGLEADYVRLFISNKAGAVPLYQSCYEFDGAPLMGPPAVRMQQRLDAVGLALGGVADGEPPDHLAIALEYVYFLLEKSFTDQNADLMGLAIIFVEKEMTAWIEKFQNRLARMPNTAIYGPAASLTRKCLTLIAP